MLVTNNIRKDEVLQILSANNGIFKVHVYTPTTAVSVRMRHYHVSVQRRRFYVSCGNFTSRAANPAKARHLELRGGFPTVERQFMISITANADHERLLVTSHRW